MCGDGQCQRNADLAGNALRAIAAEHLAAGPTDDAFTLYTHTLDELGRLASLLPELVAKIVGDDEPDVATASAAAELTRAITARRNALIRAEPIAALDHPVAG